MQQAQFVQEYFENVQKAHTEEAKKQLFFGLLHLLYQKDEIALEAINNMSIGAETRITKIELASRTKTGFADTQSRNLIIEFEKDLKKTFLHAKEQLKEYVSGNWNSGNQYNFTLIATDCLRWVVFGVDPESYLNKTVILPTDIRLVPVIDFTLGQDTIQDFFLFLDFHLFRSEPQIPTLEKIEQDFGSRSTLFLNVIGGMKTYFATIVNDTEIQTAYQEWEKFLSIAYGKFNATYEIFLIHSYLSIFAKFLGHTFVTKGEQIDALELESILNGDKFRTLRLKNFVENDFYRWVSDKKYLSHLQKHLYPVLYKINDYNFLKIDSDILKGMYQGLIDLETKQTLGEYYTPDWLCNRVVTHFEFERNAHILDPSCGSGSFLLASVQRLIELHPDISLAELCEQVVGIDIHPLSVQIAKTTLLGAISPKIGDTKDFISLRVYLANSVLTREDNVTIFGEQYRVTIDKQNYMLSKELFIDSAQVFDFGVEVADNLANKSINQEEVKPNILTSMIASKFPNISPSLLLEFHDIYKAFKQTKEQKRNGIWKFILQNNYKPYFLKQHFDYVIGNPPWFTYSSITNAEYQHALKKLADSYDITPTNRRNMPHLEIAAIFMAHSLNYFLKPKGQLSFVLPRAFLQAEQHHNTRAAIAKGFSLTGVWDLKNVQNLFNVPSCVLFATAEMPSRTIPVQGIEGRSFEGKPLFHNATWEQSKQKIKFSDNRWFLSRLNNNTALTTTQQLTTQNRNAYREGFQQGATIVPRNFYFIEAGDYTNKWEGMELWAYSHPSNQKDGKAPWRDITLKGEITANYVYRTLLAKNVLPFGYLFPNVVYLPIEVIRDTNALLQHKQVKKSIRLLHHDDILNLNYHLHDSNWFEQVEKLWNKHKTDKAKDMTYLDRINFQRGITNQDLNAPYLVLYTSSAKDANACVVQRKDIDLEFIVESATFVAYFHDLKEAYYITAFLNSQFANVKIKDFQATGLFGPRHVQKKILDVALPKYDATIAEHIRLTELGEACTTKVKDWIVNANLDANTYSIGRVRVEAKKCIESELNEIDTILEIIC